MDLALLKKQLIIDESRRLYPYMDTEAQITIGIGHNLTSNGLPNFVIELLYDNDLKINVLNNTSYLPFWDKLSDVRQRVLANMMFNMGFSKFLNFARMLKACEMEDWVAAAAEMEDSMWYRQVKGRGERLKWMMLNDKDLVNGEIPQ